MIARDVLRERINSYLRRHPDATEAMVLGRFTLDPRDDEVRAMVGAALADHRDDAARDGAQRGMEVEA